MDTLYNESVVCKELIESGLFACYINSVSVPLPIYLITFSIRSAIVSTSDLGLCASSCSPVCIKSVPMARIVLIDAAIIIPSRRTLILV